MNQTTATRQGWTLGVGLMAMVAMTSITAHAVTVVDWGGDYVSTSQVFQNTDITAEHYRSYDPTPEQGYSTLRGTNLTVTGGIQELTPSSGYTAPTGKSSSFFGGWSSSAGTGPGIPGGSSGTESFINSRSVFNNPVAGTGGDFINLSMGSSAPGIRGILGFEKSGFLNGVAANQIAFDSTSSISFSGFVNGFRPVVTWVIQDGNTWYVSQSTLTESGSGFWGTTTIGTLTDPNSALWAAYIPVATDSAGPYYYNPAPTTGYALHTFTDIQTVGVLFDSYGQPSIDGSYSEIGLQGFTVDAITVPEPSAYALASLGMISLMMVHRRLKVSA